VVTIENVQVPGAATGAWHDCQRLAIIQLSAVVQTLWDAGHCVFAAYDDQSALGGPASDIDLLITNTRSGVDGPELMRRTRAKRPGMPILHVIQGATGTLVFGPG
jgi:hypothetical protein